MGFSKLIDAFFSTSRAVACHFSSRENLISPGVCQADTPHLLFHALKLNRPNEFVCSEGERMCPATQYFGLWNDQFVSAAPEEPNFSNSMKIESVMLCPKPYFFNTGPHRATMVVTHEGERFAMAFEEAWPPLTENLFIGAFTEAGASMISEKGRAEKIAMMAIEAATLTSLKGENHIFVTEVVSDAAAILEPGCTPSPKMHAF